MSTEANAPELVAYRGALLARRAQAEQLIRSLVTVNFVRDAKLKNVMRRQLKASASALAIHQAWQPAGVPRNPGPPPATRRSRGA